ncbi:putative LPS assembly protein LptD [Hymenobacter persicinus]|uniref:LPS-assembly protein LptD n=1 Tax=Hymenobacter persicinus TaxID=2025506 RepID=A0A4Q5LBI7_9BACT|nr:putative LPS assembly protein LptD [Hymenobacter persicinus]RYU79747.1 LPS-assembly protein LptD [Hymenobacter persicinus]
MRPAFLLLLVLLGLGSGPAAWGQRRPAKASTPAAVRPLNVDGRPATNPLPADTARIRRAGQAGSIALDTTRRSDSLRVAAAPTGDIKTTVKYAAKDSIRFEVENKQAILYDKATVDYGEMSLKAARITVDYAKNLLTAEGAADTTGKVRDKPVFKDGATTYAAGRINYNFKTKKGRITDAVTSEGEGFVHAETIKKNELNEIFGRNGRYTTCNLEHPHFFINATKMKVIPKEKVVTGPFNLVVGDIPTPLGFLFGYFPMPNKSRASGLIIPTFGQTADRGFALRNGGYYWVPNEYIGVRLTGDIYSGNAATFGGFGTTAEMQYLKRYTYDGRLNFSFSQRPASQILAPTSVNTDQTYRKPRAPKTFWLTWNHTPTPRPGGGRFSASVQAGSTDYNQQNQYDTRLRLTPSFSSTISYQKQIRNSPVNYALNLSQSQNTGTGAMDFTLPDVTVGVARQYLYELLGLKARPLYQQFSVAYTLTGQNKISNYQQARALANGIPLLGGTVVGNQIPVKFSNLGTILRNSQTGLQHAFQISLGSYTVLKHLSLQPSFNYGETWYGKRLDYTYIPAAQAVRIDTVRGFNRVYSYSSGLNLGTNVYGVYVIKGKKIEAIRHKLTPNLSYQYSPDFTSNRNFYAIGTNLGPLTNSSGLRYNQEDPRYPGDNTRLLNPISFSRYQGFLYGTPSGRQVSAVSFSLQNSVEMKVRDTQDTTGTTPFKKVSLIDGLDFNIGYNFAAESLRLSPLSSTFRTQVARKLNVLLAANFEFYQRDSTGLLINKYLLDQSKRRLARLSNANLSLSYQFNPVQGKKKSVVPRTVAPTNDPALGNPQPVNPYEDYVDFELPWDLSSNFTASYTDPGPLPARPGRLRPSPITAGLSLSGSVKLTPNLRFGYSTGYDFKNQTVSYTSLNVFRDLHCWQINGQWFPFGTTRGYFVTIAAKSSLLQDLKLNRNRSFLTR